MTYFQFELDHPKEEAASRFVAEVGRLLQGALVERKTLGKLTQQEIADRLDVDRSAVNRSFNGYRNLSIEKLAELCWAMDVEPTLVLDQLLKRDNGNHHHEGWAAHGNWTRDLPRTASSISHVKVSR